MKIGDKINVRDGSYGFGIRNGEVIQYLNNMDDSRKNLTIVKTGLYVMSDADEPRHGAYSRVNDLLVTDGNGNFWFTQSRLCELVDKEIKVKYICNGVDVTGSISDETKRNLV